MPFTPPHEAYPSCLLAQKLNNRAVRCIESAEYEEAVSHLVKALRISEESSAESYHSSDDDVDTKTCPCVYCSLDYCMTYSQQLARQSETNPVDDYDEFGGYVYSQPIRISPQTMDEGHSMRGVLPLILTFNMALAHHLHALQCRSSGVLERSKLQRVLRLYELAYRWQIEEEDSQVESLLFTMAIANNLAEIHRTVSDREKHQKCLQHLLSTLMFIVDCNQEGGGGCPPHGGGNNTMDMEGFFLNTSELILHNRCAGAA